MRLCEYMEIESKSYSAGPNVHMADLEVRSTDGNKMAMKRESATRDLSRWFPLIPPFSSLRHLPSFDFIGNYPYRIALGTIWPRLPPSLPCAHELCSGQYLHAHSICTRLHRMCLHADSYRLQRAWETGQLLPINMRIPAHCWIG